MISFNKKPNIFLYWENKKNITNRPEYLDLCKDTVIKHCNQDFQIHFITDQTIDTYLPNIPPIIRHWQSIPQKADYYRICLLMLYGGIWLDTDIIIFRSLKEFSDRLDTFDYIGFGCYYKNCIQTTNIRKPYPANWVMISRKNGIIITKLYDEMMNILFNHPEQISSNYHCFGKTLFKKVIDDFYQNSTFNQIYLHISSRCIERDSNGIKITISRLISNEEIDEFCKQHLILLPLYNTAPGFPKQFLQLTKEQILQKNYLISKYFRFSLK